MTAKKVVIFVVFCVLATGLGMMAVNILQSDPDELVYQPSEEFVLIGDSFKKMGVGHMMVVKRLSDEAYVNAILLAERTIAPGTRVLLTRNTDRRWRLFSEYYFLSITGVEKEESPQKK